MDGLELVQRIVGSALHVCGVPPPPDDCSREIVDAALWVTQWAVDAGYSAGVEAPASLIAATARKLDGGGPTAEVLTSLVIGDQVHLGENTLRALCWAVPLVATLFLSYLAGESPVTVLRRATEGSVEIVPVSNDAPTPDLLVALLALFDPQVREAFDRSQERLPKPTASPSREPSTGYLATFSIDVNSIFDNMLAGDLARTQAIASVLELPDDNPIVYRLVCASRPTAVVYENGQPLNPFS